ncbi:PDZ domain-containing protein [Winogradskyella sp.]|uniref:PDZ domain-containing protein n=1 Tax=Winogradskyella sp. TaxID=1883156 RepID=UPI0025EFBADA|nr:PDZ domain-containing protein [Winogradskyella sp.]
MLGLALDLSLREQDLNLDDYMKLVWKTYGKPFKNYTVKDLHNTLNTYAGNEFGDTFFNNYIYKSEMPDFEQLFNTVGVSLKQNLEKSAFGLRLRNNEIIANTKIGSAAYNAGLEKGDKIVKIASHEIKTTSDLNKALSEVQPNKTIKILYEKYGKIKAIKMKLDSDTSYIISSFPELSEVQIKNRKAWLGVK